MKTSIKLLELLRRESDVSPRRLLWLAGIAGLSNTLILAVINAAAEKAAAASHSTWLAALLLVILVLYIVSQQHLLTVSAREVEKILHRIRVRLSDKIRRADLLPLEKIGRSQIYASINKETLTISQVVSNLVVAVQSGVVIVFVALYLAYLSVTAFVLTVLFIGIALSVHFKKVRQFSQDAQQAAQRENALFDSLTDMLDGFKEVKMNQARSAALFEEIRSISEATKQLKVRTQTQIAQHIVFTQTTFYVLMAVVVFVLPRFQPTYSDVVVKTATTILFSIGPISTLVGSLPLFASANAACENIEALEKLLDQAVERVPEPAEGIAQLAEIRFEGVRFHYRDPRAARQFAVGPIDLSIAAGETLFITGGNGSGKSTFLKLLTALYYPEEGRIRINGRVVDESNLAAYRDLFSVAFSDYHLFKRLYGLAEVSPEELERWLHEMELEDKTRVRGGAFETLELSAGQRKRLALLTSLLEDRPILVLDEWAAEQDPVFKRRFYEELLPELKRRRKTIIAITHDDRYFGVADRRLKMEDGRFVVTEEPAS